MNLYKLAELLYTKYCKDVGGVNFKGDPLPDWHTFFNDRTKTKQAMAWYNVARNAYYEFITPPSVKPDEHDE